MSVIRLSKRKQYTVIAQASLRDERLSLKARGLHAYLLSFPDDWQFSIKHIVSQLPDGRTAIRSALAELVEYGYADAEHPRKKDGTIAGTRYIIHEAPRDRKPDSRSFG